MFKQGGFIQYNINVLLVISFVLFLLACPKMQTINDMSPKEKVAWIMGVYNSQFADYMITAGYNLDLEGNWIKTKKVDLSEEQKQTLREKKSILTELYPLILVYDGYVERGLTPDRETEQQIMELINRIQ